jgi:GT2 family glycosyltransferase
VGIALIPKTSSWVLFMDDDIILNPKAITNALTILKYSSEPILGIGFGYASKEKFRGLKSFFNSKMPGRVTSDGRNLSYATSKETISTEWLNGISMWHKSVLHKYDFPYLDSKYSICEDLIYSYGVSRLGKIIYAPSCRFTFQLDEPKLVSSFDSFRANAYWRLYFVLTNPPLSKNRFLFVEFYRTMKFLLDKIGSGGRRVEVCLIYLDLIKVVSTCIDPLVMLKTRRV